MPPDAPDLEQRINDLTVLAQALQEQNVAFLEAARMYEHAANHWHAAWVEEVRVQVRPAVRPWNNVQLDTMMLIRGWLELIADRGEAVPNLAPICARRALANLTRLEGRVCWGTECAWCGAQTYHRGDQRDPDLDIHTCAQCTRATVAPEPSPKQAAS